MCPRLANRLVVSDFSHGLSGLHPRRAKLDTENDTIPHSGTHPGCLQNVGTPNAFSEHHNNLPQSLSMFRASSLMGHILTHDCLHINNDTLCHLAIMYVNKMYKKQKGDWWVEVSLGLSLCRGLVMRLGTTWFFGAVCLHRGHPPPRPQTLEACRSAKFSPAGHWCLIVTNVGPNIVGTPGTGPDRFPVSTQPTYQKFQLLVDIHATSMGIGVTAVKDVARLPIPCSHDVGLRSSEQMSFHMTGPSEAL